MRTPPHSWIVFLLAICAAIPAFGHVKSSGRQVFELDHPEQVAFSITVRNGSIEAEGWDSSAMVFEFTKSAESRGLLDKTLIYFHETDDSISVRVKAPGNGHGFFSWFGDGDNGSVSFKVRLPRRMSILRLQGENGSITVKGARGPVQASTTNGSISLHGVEADSKVETTNGSITVHCLNGNTKAETVNGSVKITVAGTLTDMVRAETVNGDITLQLPPQADADVHLETVNGSISSATPLTVQGALKKNSLKGRLGNGGISVRAETVNGDINLK